MSTLSVVEFLLSGFLDSSGNPLASGKVYTYAAGTSTPKATYTDVTGLTPETNPVILNSSGRKQIFADGSYKFVIKDSNDATIDTFDNLYFGTTLDLNAREATDAGDATARTSLITLGQVQDGKPNFVATVGGTGDVITLTPTVPITAYVNGQRFVFKVAAVNTTSVTINVSGVGAVTVVKEPGLATLTRGDLIPGDYVEVVYDSTNARFHLVTSSTRSVLIRTATDISISNSAVETTIFTTTLTANSLNSYRGVRLTMFGIADNDTGADRTFTWNLKLGATTIATNFNTISNDPGNNWVCTAIILANNATNAQKGMISATMTDAKATQVGETVVGYGTAAEDSTTNLTLTVTMTLSTASASLTFGLKGAVLEIL